MPTFRSARRALVSILLLFFFLYWLGSESAFADSRIPAGLGSFEFAPDSKHPKHKLKVWTCRPEKFNEHSPILFVMHGVKRHGKSYRDNWAEHSQRYGFLLLVPEFPEDDYPGEMYQQGNIVNAKGRAVPPEHWTFTIIERLFDQVKELTRSKVDRYFLYGHSAGGQFVHRFVLFMPDARYARAIAANPGFYTVPTQVATYPYGLKGTHLDGSIGPEVFARDFVLLLGTADTQRDDPDLRKTPEADVQGLNRFERGHFYFRAVQRVAKESDAKFHWRLVDVPGVGHSNAKMSESAARELFGKKQ